MDQEVIRLRDKYKQGLEDYFTTTDQKEYTDYIDIVKRIVNTDIFTRRNKRNI